MRTHFGLDRLYALCALLRDLLDPLNIGRVIARPFTAKSRPVPAHRQPQGFFRAAPEPTLLDRW